VLNKGNFVNFAKHWLTWQRTLRNWKGVHIYKDNANTTHLVKKMVTVGLIYPEIIWLSQKRRNYER